MNFLLAFLLVSVVTIAIDFIWLGYVAKKTILALIKPYIMIDAQGGLVVRPIYALLSWLLIVFGVYFFVIKPAVNNNDIFQILINGAVFGFVSYGIYDFTTAAIQTMWPLEMIVLDVAWGALLCAICSGVWFFALQK